MATTLADLILTARRDDPALDAGSILWTYGDLVREANVLAAQLIGSGAGPESVVALDLPSGPRFVAAMVACGLVGGAFMPMDPRDPAARRGQMNDIARPAAVVTSSEVRALDESERLDSRLAPRMGAAAYVSFTSGSTGSPKAVVTEHPAAVNYIRQSAARFGLGPGDRQLQLSAVTFDIAIDEIFSTLSAGATLVFRDADFVYAGVEGFLEHCESRGITVLNLPTGLWNRFGAELAERPDVVLPSCLRLTVVGGEAAGVHAVQAWHDAATAPGYRMVNAYGPTEAAVSVTFADLLPGEPVAIGTEIDGVTVDILDDALEPVEPGEVGELVIKGLAPARGYLEGPGAGFVEIDGAWSYRTGDLGRREPSGQLMFHGRIDDQVKVRGGYRVQPSGVEQVILAHPAARQVAVVPLRRGHASVLGALVVVEGDSGLDDPAHWLRQFAAERLPAWMVPSIVKVVDELPLTERGKVDTAAVVRLLTEGPEGGQNEVSGDVGALVEEAWTSVLGSAPVSGEDNFFEEGGDSLAALELVEILATRAGVNLPVTDLYRAPTFAALVALAESDAIHIPTAHHVSGRTIVKLRKGGSARLWCFLPPLSGAVTRYASMARLLPARDAVWAMETPAALSGAGMGPLVEGLGKALLEQDLEPFDTVVLSGYSLGGVFAHELATYIEPALSGRDGGPIQVQALLLDPPDPAEPQMTLHEAFDIFVRVGWRIPETVDDFLSPEGEFEMARVAQAARRAGTLSASAADREVTDAWEVYASNTRVLDNHSLSAATMGSRVLQCRDVSAPVGKWAPTRASGSWGIVLGTGQASAIAVEHFQLMEAPNDATVARWLVRESDSLRVAAGPVSARAGR